MYYSLDSIANILIRKNLIQRICFKLEALKLEIQSPNESLIVRCLEVLYIYIQQAKCIFIF